MSGAEIAIEWNGRPARAWLPDLLAARDLDLPVDIARETERAAGGGAPGRRPAAERVASRSLGSC